MPKILLFANTDWYLYNFRLSLAKELRQRGNDVILLSPPGEFSNRLQEEGFQWISFPLSRRGVNPFKEVRSIIKLLQTYRTLQPDLVHHHTIKCVLYGTLAATFTRIPAIVNSITGRGFIFSSTNPLAIILKPVVKLIYKMSFSFARIKVIFENKTDLVFFLENKLLEREQVNLIPGVGVDIKRFYETSKSDANPIILLATRMLWDKGVGVFVDAAKLVNKQQKRARFVLVGGVDEGNPGSINKETLEQWHNKQIVEWWGFREDMPSIYSSCTIFSFPTMYGEGVPTVLLEASACSRPLIATDVPGCRDVVTHGVNGLLVPPKNPQALAKAIESLLTNPNLRTEMGKAGRRLAQEKFSLEKIIEQTLDVYQKALGE
jgi:glycosyltransferase involved in cell wall biosynthesis